MKELAQEPESERATLRSQNNHLRQKIEHLEGLVDKRDHEKNLLESSIIKTNEEVIRLKRLLAMKDDQLEDLQTGGPAQIDLTPEQ